MAQSKKSERAWRWGVWGASDRQWHAELERRHAQQLDPTNARTARAATTIPHIIHHIWLGPHEIPAQCVAWMETWRKHHPQWTHRIWRDEDVASFRPKNEKAYTDAKNFGEKSDILRYEILERVGGVYVDIDMQCLQPIDILTESFSFVVGISNTGCVEINNAVVASVPGHPILKQLIEKIYSRANQPRLDTDMLTHIAQLSGVDRGAFGNTSTPMATIERTGPGLMTRTFMEAVGWTSAPAVNKLGFLSREEQATVIALPVEYFYPLPNNQKDGAASSFPSRAVAVHHWQRTWMAGIDGAD